MALDGAVVAFVGAGNMAKALARGVVAKGVVPASAVRLSSPSGGGAADLAGLGVACTTSNAVAVEGAHVVVLCVKPWIVAPALRSIAGSLREDATIVSVAAGTSIAQIAGELAAAGVTGARVVRVMPNTPCAIGAGASAMCLGPTAGPADAARVRALFSAVGTVESVTEPQLDAVTGLSGSGPAYVFMFIEALADGGVAAGLPRGVAMALATQLVRGASTMVQETGSHPGALKDAVASPAGTTIAGIHALETAGFRGAVMSAVVAASKRCAELRNAS